MYVLATRGDPAVKPLTPHEAFMHIAANSYGIRWFLRETNVSQFHRRARLAREVPARLLERSMELGRLEELVELVETDARSALCAAPRLVGRSETSSSVRRAREP